MTVNSVVTTVEIDVHQVSSKMLRIPSPALQFKHLLSQCKKVICVDEEGREHIVEIQTVNIGSRRNIFLTISPSNVKCVKIKLLLASLDSS